MTALEIATVLASRAGKPEPETERDFRSLGIPMFGGCQRCGETLAAYNAHPQKNGYWACQECSMEPILSMHDWDLATQP